MLLPVLYRAAYMGFMFVANLLLANLLAPAGLGVLSLLVLNASLLSLISSIGSDAMTMHALVQHKWSLNYGISFLLKITVMQAFVFGLLQSGSLVISGKALLSQAGAEMVWVEFLYFIGLVIAEKMLVLYYITERPKLYNTLLLITGIVYLALLCAFWAIEIQLNLEEYLLLVALYSFLQGLLLSIVYFFTQKSVQIERIKWLQTLTILKTSVVVMITNVVQLLAYRVDFWLLRHFHSNYEVGVYAQANKFASLLWLLPNILGMLLIPRFGSMTAEEMPAVFRLANLLNLLMVFVTALVTWILYHYFLLPQYRSGLDAFWLMLPGYFSWALVTYFGAFISWKGTFTINLLASSCCLFMICIIDLLLIPRFSIYGAALGNTVAYSAVLCLYFYLLARTKAFRAGELVLFHAHDMKLLKKWFN